MQTGSGTHLGTFSRSHRMREGVFAQVLLSGVRMKEGVPPQSPPPPYSWLLPGLWSSPVDVDGLDLSAS